MKKNGLFVLFGATILLTMNACKSELDLDKELKFSKLSVEEQKASIEQNGLDFVTAMEGMQDTKAMTTVMNMLEMSGGEVFGAPMQKLTSDIKNARKSAFSNFDKQMRVSYVKSEDEVWGEYKYNFTTDEIELVKSLTNKLIVSFPASETAKNNKKNNAVVTVTYEESTVAIPNAEDMDLEEVGIDKYPSKITFSMTVDGAEVMSADFSGKYYSDGSPQEVKQSLTMETFEWTAEVKNDKKTASESYEFKNGKTTLLKSSAEVKGTLTEAELQKASENGTPEDAISEFAIYFQVMDVAVKGGTKDFKGFMTEGKALDYDKLTDKQYAEKTVEIINKYMVCNAYFVDANRKFADVEFYVNEYQYQDYDYSTYPYVLKTFTDYEIAPRFILSDGSKVAVEDYVMDGFDKFINKIEDMQNDFDY
jgi:hypothetical protein